VTKELGWLQQTPEGDLAIVYVEAADLERMFQEMAASTEPYDLWFRQQVLEIHGLDLNQPPEGPVAELDFEWSR
jgi:hypothetical protein